MSSKKFTFAIPDVHGNYDVMRVALQAIENYADEGTIVFTGDYVDRGHQSKEVIQCLIDGPNYPDKWKWVVLKGNHEEMLFMAVAYGALIHNWLKNGGHNTLLSYGYTDHLTGNFSKLKDALPQSHLDFIKDLPYVYQEEHRVFVHAYLDNEEELDSQDREKMVWHRVNDTFDVGYKNRHVVHGHDPHIQPLLLKNRSNFDTLAWKNDAMHIGVFDNEVPGGPVALLRVDHLGGVDESKLA